MGGQNNLPADTGRSDLRTWGVSERAGRGPGPRGGRGAEIGMRGKRRKKERGNAAGKNKRQGGGGGKNKGMKPTDSGLSLSLPGDDDVFNEATVNSHSVSPSPPPRTHSKIHAIRRRN